MTERNTIWEPLRILLAEFIDLGITDLPGDWKRQPENKDELEGVVEWEPVDSADRTLEDGQESEDHPVLENMNQRTPIASGVHRYYREPLCIIRFTDSEKSFQGIVTRNHEPSNISE